MGLASRMRLQPFSDRSSIPAPAVGMGLASRMRLQLNILGRVLKYLYVGMGLASRMRLQPVWKRAASISASCRNGAGFSDEIATPPVAASEQMMQNAVGMGLASRMRLQLCFATSPGILLSVGMGLASRMRLQLTQASGFGNGPYSRNGAGFSDEIATR